jgi:hypothetical protein
VLLAVSAGAVFCAWGSIAGAIIVIVNVLACRDGGSLSGGKSWFNRNA